TVPATRRRSVMGHGSGRPDGDRSGRDRSRGDRLVRYDAGADHATLTLDSPHNRNALSPRMFADFAEGLRRAQNDPRVRAVVLTHPAGTFCAGADPSAASGAAGPDPGTEPAGGDAQSPTEAMAALLRSILECPKPVIARIDGHVRAGGMGLVGACDIV